MSEKGVWDKEDRGMAMASAPPVPFSIIISQCANTALSRLIVLRLPCATDRR